MAHEAEDEVEIRLEGKRAGEESWWKRAGRDPSVSGQSVTGPSFLAVSDLHTSCTTRRAQVQNWMHDLCWEQPMCKDDPLKIYHTLGSRWLDVSGG